jgi:hypothetical protein
MSESKQRISGIAPGSGDERMRRVFEKQARKWGAPLANHLVYARRPPLFHAARAMWEGLYESGLIEGTLAALLNRRVALLNGCEF